MRGLYSVREYLKLDAATKRQNVDRALDDLERLLMEKDDPDWRSARICIARIVALSCITTGSVYLLIGLLGVRP